MNKKTKGNLIQLATVLLVWVPFIMFSGPQFIVADVFGLKVIPIAALVCGILSSFWNSLFQMGVKDWKESNVFQKALPILYLIGLLYLVTLTQQTYVTAVISSMFLGVLSSYIGRILVAK